MNILLITPGLNKKFNENYFSYKKISQKNKILIISNKQSLNKGGESYRDPEIEIDGNIKIYRIFDTIRKQQSFIYRFFFKSKIDKIVQNFNPEIIICEEISNLSFAIYQKKKLSVPIIFRTEFLFNSEYPYRTMGRFLKIFKNKITGDFFPILFAKIIWNWAYSNSDSVIYCYNEEKKNETLELQIPFYYVPWPTYLPDTIKKISIKKNQGVFIGALDTHKNIIEFSYTLPKLLKYTPLKKFIFVGEGRDINIIKKLQKDYPKSIIHIPSLPREKCLELIGKSLFSYSPAIRGGWAFIGDSWAMKTPIIVTNNHYDFKDNLDSIVTSEQNIVDRVNSLFREKKQIKRIIYGGYERFSKYHSADSVGLRYLEICKLTLQKFN